jgi:hypothetical protein
VGWNDTIRAIQDNVQQKLLAPIGYTTFAKIVRTWGSSFFSRVFSDPGAGPAAAAAALGEEPPEEDSEELAPLDLPVPDGRGAPHIRSLNERGVLEYLIEDPAIQGAIDAELKSMLAQVKQVLHSSFQALKSSQRGEIASDLFKNRILLCGDHYFDLHALARHLTAMTGFRFETLGGTPVADGLRRMLAAPQAQRRYWHELCLRINAREALALSRM